MRFFIRNLAAAPGESIIMDGDNARHAAAVLRAAAGDECVVCDGAGTDYVCVVKSVGKTSLSLTVLERKLTANEPSANSYLFLSLLKWDKTEIAVQKSVELGVKGVYLVSTKNSVVRGVTADRLKRLEKIAEGAAKQSGRGIIPDIKELPNLDSAVKTALNLKTDIALAAHEKSRVPLKRVLNAVKKASSAAVFIGPEGGFDDAEAAAFAEAGICLVSLGSLVLRAETAAIAALACIQYELDG